MEVLRMAIKKKTQCGWMKWREALGILCDKRMPLRYKVVVRPIMYGLEC